MSDEELGEGFGATRRSLREQVGAKLANFDPVADCEFKKVALDKAKKVRMWLPAFSGVSMHVLPTGV